MPVPDVKDEIVRQRPKHFDEGGQQNRGLQQADAKIGRQLGEMACILVHALIGVHPHRARLAKPESPSGLHPILDQIERQTSAELQFQRFNQPALRYVQNQESSGNQTKDAQLHQELRKVAARQGIIEGLVPAVEAYLSVGGHGYDEEQRARQPEKRGAHRRRPQGPDHHAELRHEAGIGNLFGVRFAVHARLWSNVITPLSGNAAAGERN